MLSGNPVLTSILVVNHNMWQLPFYLSVSPTLSREWQGQYPAQSTGKYQGMIYISFRWKNQNSFGKKLHLRAPVLYWLHDRSCLNLPPLTVLPAPALRWPLTQGFSPQVFAFSHHVGIKQEDYILKYFENWKTNLRKESNDNPCDKCVCVHVYAFLDVKKILWTSLSWIHYVAVVSPRNRPKY